MSERSERCWYPDHSILPDEASAESVVIAGSRCAACGEVRLPAAAYCASCPDFAETQPYRLAPSGRVRSHTEVQVAPPGFRTPFSVLLVGLDDGPNLVARWEGQPGGVAVGDAVRIVQGGAPIRDSAEGPVYSYAVRAAGEEVAIS